jgi:hypothetical protein
MMRITQEHLDNWFIYHPPTDPSVASSYEALRAGAKAFAELILQHTPSSADQTAALRKLREVVFTANASIACGGK